MGTPMAPTYAILFMYAIEHKHLRQALFYVRYIDDIFSIFPSVEDGNEFISTINSIIPDRLQLEAITHGKEAVFLDIRFNMNDNGLISYSVYQKPMNTFLYIPTSSDHAPSVFKSFVLAELKRYYKNCSDFSTFTAVADAFKIRLSDRGYQPSIFNSAYHTLLTRHLPMNLESCARSRGIPDSCHAPQQQHQTAPPRVHQESSKRSARQRKLHQPILIINMPILNHSINWRQLAMIPADLRDTLAFQLAFRSTDIIINKCSPRTLGNLYISSVF